MRKSETDHFRATPCRVSAGNARAHERTLRTLYRLALIVGLLLACVVGPAAPSPAFEEEIAGTFFRVFGDDRVFARRVAGWADGYRTGIPPLFGFDRRAEGAPRTTRNTPPRGSIYLHPSRDAFVLATGVPAWAAGVASGRRDIHAFIDSDALSVAWQRDKLLHRTLPHELTHHLFRDFLGPAAKNVPRWVHEGVAMAAERNAAREQMRRLRIMGEWLRQEKALPFDQFQKIVPTSLDEAGAQLFYSQAATVTGYLQQIHGAKRFLLFLASLRDGVPVADALGVATDGKIATLSELEAAWRNYVLKNTEAGPARALRAQPLPDRLRVAAVLPEGARGDLAAHVGRRILVVQWFDDVGPTALEPLRRLSSVYRREWRKLALVWVFRGSADGAELRRLLTEAGLPPPCPLVPDADGSASARLRRESGLTGPGPRAVTGGTFIAVLDRRGRVAFDGVYGPAAEAAVEQTLDDDASEP